MDLDPALTRDVGRIVLALHRFGKDRGWIYSFGGFPISIEAGEETSEDERPWYHIDITVNVDWYRLFVTFYVHRRAGVERQGLLTDLRAHLARRLGDKPALLSAINLDAQVVSDIVGPMLPLGPSDVRVDEEFVDDLQYHVQSKPGKA